MVISFRAHDKNIEVARYKAIRAMNIAFVTLFLVVFFYAVSFNLALGHDQAVKACQGIAVNVLKRFMPEGENQ
ncbi:MAG: hypothetical protein M3Z43_00190 [Bifidobacterium sp.]|uniref:hypothetical protein n=1 Tax=Bifidobacterium apicola TaxID=3230739 RepID=UPI0036F27FFB|nr:hypothetical protein [Bifidobacterium sp.]